MTRMRNEDVTIIGAVGGQHPAPNKTVGCCVLTAPQTGVCNGK